MQGLAAVIVGNPRRAWLVVAFANHGLRFVLEIHVERAGIGQHGTIGGGLARSDVELLDHRGALICSGSLVRQINMNPLIAICRIEVMRHLDLLDIIWAVFHSHSGISGLVLLDGGSQTFGGVPGTSHFNTIHAECLIGTNFHAAFVFRRDVDLACHLGNSQFFGYAVTGDVLGDGIAVDYQTHGATRLIHRGLEE